MRDLNVIAIECIRELEIIGIQCGKVTEFAVNTRAKRRWGLCRKNGDGTFSININADLLLESTNIDGLKNTIIHELLHTCPNCFCHTGEWKRLADKVNRYYGYGISRCSTAADKGIDEKVIQAREIERQRKRNNPKYIFKCKGCGQIVTRQRKSDFTEYYRLYHCARCHGAFEPVKNA